MATSAPGINYRSGQAEPAGPPAALRSYHVELPLDLLDEQGNTLDWVIGFAFDTLDARHLNLRIVADTTQHIANHRNNQEDILMQSLTVTDASVSSGTPQARTVSLMVENIRIHVADQGAGSPTLLLHGIFDSADVWRGVTQHLQANYRCLAPDLPGFGRSGESADFDCTLPHLAEFIDNLISALGINEPINLVGYDIGATYGLAWAVTHPAKVRHLAILNANFFSDYKWHPFARLWRIPVVGEMVMAGLTESNFARAMVSGAPQIPLETAREAARQVTPAAKRMALRHYRALDSAVFRGWEDRLRDVTAQVPTIVCWGDQDPVISPSFAERFGAQEVHHFTANSHWLPLEAPGALAERLDAFFREDS